MDLNTDNIKRFINGPNLSYAVRQSGGILIPVLSFFWLGGDLRIGLAVASGALCIGLIDQQGGTKRSRMLQMLAGVLLANLSALITSLTLYHPLVSGIAIVAQIFFFSMFSVFGARGGFIAFGCMLTIVLTLSVPIHNTHQALTHCFFTFCGCVFYLVYSVSISYVLRMREERQTLAAALYATASYMTVRGQFYDINIDLDDCYRRLRPAMSLMNDSQQTARDVVLRNLPAPGTRNQRQKTILWNIFVDMIALLDTMVASQTDYAVLRQRFGNHDILLFMRDTLLKLSKTLDKIGLSLSSGSHYQYRSSVKAELRAIEYEVFQLRQQGLNETEPEIYALTVKILRRLRNASRFIDRMANNLRDKRQLQPLETVTRDHTLLQFQNRGTFNLRNFTHSFHMGSAVFRYSLRVTIAVALVIIVTALMSMRYGHTAWMKTFSSHSYWVVMTILIIMRPGFAMTRQRTVWRLVGTFLGCLITLALFKTTHSGLIYFVVMMIAMVLGMTFAAVNYKLSAFFITIYVLIGFHFLMPGDLVVVGERALDTLLACMISYACSFIFPWWERDQILALAKNTIKANQTYLRTCINYAAEMHGSEPEEAIRAKNPLFIQKQLARKNLHNTFSAFSDSYSRMLNEPKAKQIHIASFNNLLIHTEAMGSLTSAITPDLASLEKIPPNMQQSLAFLQDCLDIDNLQTTKKPQQIESDAHYGALTFPLKQMQLSATRIRQESEKIGIAPNLNEGQLT